MNHKLAKFWWSNSENVNIRKFVYHFTNISNFKVIVNKLHLNLGWCEEKLFLLKGFIIQKRRIVDAGPKLSLSLQNTAKWSKIQNQTNKHKAQLPQTP